MWAQWAPMSGLAGAAWHEFAAQGLSWPSVPKSDVLA